MKSRKFRRMVCRKVRNPPSRRLNVFAGNMRRVSMRGVCPSFDTFKNYAHLRSRVVGHLPVPGFLPVHQVLDKSISAKSPTSFIHFACCGCMHSSLCNCKYECQLINGRSKLWVGAISCITKCLHASLETMRNVQLFTSSTTANYPDYCCKSRTHDSSHRLGPNSANCKFHGLIRF